MQCAYAVLVIRSLSGSIIFFHCLIQGKIYGKNITEHIMCVLIFLCNICVKYVSFYEEFSDILPSMYKRLHI